MLRKPLNPKSFDEFYKLDFFLDFLNILKVFKFYAESNNWI